MSDIRYPTLRELAEGRRYGGDLQLRASKVCALFDLLDAAHETMRLAAEWIAEPEPKGERPDVVEAMLRSMMAEIEVRAR